MVEFGGSIETPIKFDFQPELLGPNVTVRPIAVPDWQEMYQAASDPLIWEQHPAVTRYQEPVFRRYFDEAIASGSAFTIIDRASGRIIGTSRYSDIDSLTNEIEIGWTFLTREFWGGSCNQEVKSLMLEHAFRFVDVVLFFVAEGNIRSQRAVQKLGAIARQEIFFRDNNAEAPYRVSAVSKTQWQARA